MDQLNTLGLLSESRAFAGGENQQHWRIRRDARGKSHALPIENFFELETRYVLERKDLSYHFFQL